MNFSEALDLIKGGKRLARQNWNANGQFVFLVAGSTFYVNREPLLTHYPKGTKINYRGHIDLKAADDTIGVWQPSMSDVLADDWEMVE